MDQKLLDALNNLSDALEMISDALKDKKGGDKAPTTQALQSGDFSKQITSISVDVKSIKKDTQEILKHQKTILSMSQKGDKNTGVLEEAGDKKSESNLKKGVGAIILIAVGVLAIGMALKIIGKVDFLSVVGLGIAIVLISVAFEKVAKLNITTAQAFQTSKVLVMIAAAVMLSSIALSFIKPLSFAQLITATFVALTFAVLSKYLPEIFLAVIIFDRLKINPIKLGIVLVSIAAAITASSYVLGFIKPMSFAQSITAILIAAMFAVISFNMEKIAMGVLAFDRLKVSPMALVKTLLGISAAITVSSWILGLIKPLSLFQFLTAIGIAVMFAVMSYVMDKLAIGVVLIEKFLGAGKIFLIPIVFVAISLAITLSSHILDKAVAIDFVKLLKIALLGIALAFVTLVMLPAIVLVGLAVMSGIGAGALLAGLAMIPLVAMAIMLSSHILAAGDYSKYPSFSWAMGVGTSMLGFSVSMIALGALVMTGIGAIALGLGAAAVLGVASTIVATAEILSKGNFSKYPSLGWAVGVGLLITSFGLATIALGAFILGTFGLGGLALKKGSEAIKNIAQSIVDTAVILGTGNFSGGPTKAWAEGVSLAIGAFAPVYGMLVADGIMKLFGGGASPADFSTAIKTISEGILYSATLFVGTEGIFKGGPTKAWSEGVGTAISAFAPVFKILMADGILKIFGGGIDTNSMKSAIMTISQGIVDAALFFNGKGDLFKEGGYPSETWGKNVGLALAAFSPVYEAISGKSWYQSSGGAVESLTEGVKSMANAIVSVATSFSDPKVSWTSYPSDLWSGGITAAIKSFVEINDFLVDKDISDSVVRIAKKIAKVAKILSDGPFVNNIDPNFMKSMQSNVFYYVALTKKLTESSGGLADMAKSALLGDPITNAAKGMVKLAGAYDKLANSLKNFSSAINSLDPKKIGNFKELSNVVMKAGEKKNTSLVDNVAGAIESAVSGVGDFLSSVVGSSDSGKSTSKEGSIIKTPGSISKYGDMSGQLDMVIELLVKLNGSTKSLDVYLKEKMGGSSGADVTSSSSSSSSWF